MRIIAGERKGHVLAAPKGMATRPTLSRVRESLFSILGERIVDARVLDLYAGAGGLGFEALSRGAAHCVFVERAIPAIKALRLNVEKLRYADRCTVIQADVHTWFKRPTTRDGTFDLIFSDPPYALEPPARVLSEVEKYLSLDRAPLLIVQCGSREILPQLTDRFALARTEKYGETALHFYEVKDSPAPDGA